MKTLFFVLIGAFIATAYFIVSDVNWARITGKEYMLMVLSAQFIMLALFGFWNWILMRKIDRLPKRDRHFGANEQPRI